MAARAEDASVASFTASALLAFAHWISAIPLLFFVVLHAHIMSDLPTTSVPPYMWMAARAQSTFLASFAASAPAASAHWNSTIP